MCIRDRPEAALNIELPEVFVPEPEKLNLAYCFSPDSDTTNVMDSKAGQIYQSLSIMDADWLDNIYNISGMTPEKLAEKLGLPRQSVIGKYNKRDERHQKENPDTWTVNAWKNVNIAVYDGNGRRVSGTSNVKEILSMASVFTYFQDYEDETTFLQYAKDLWKNSHSYQILSLIHIYNKTITKSGELLEKDGPAYKIITSEQWSLVFQLTEDDVKEYSSMENLEITFPGYGLTINGKFTISAGADGKSYGKVDFDKYLVQFASERFIKFEVNADPVQGLKIPVTSVISKDFFLVPIDYLAQGGDSSDSGFYKEVYSDKGTSVVFVPTTLYLSLIHI